MKFEDLKGIEREAERLIDLVSYERPEIMKDGPSIEPKELGYRFKWMNGKKQMGKCHTRKRTIELSKPICELNLDKGDKIRDTILHEIAHAISEHIFRETGMKAYHGHRIGWKRVASTIGANPQRCFNPEELGMKMPEGKYRLQCDNCGRFQTFHRRPKRTGACAYCCRVNNAFTFEKMKHYALRIYENY